MDDGSGVLIPHMTLTQTNLRAHARMGLEAMAAIQQAAQEFAAAMNEAAADVDMLAPESIEFRQAYNDLEEEFSVFMDKVPLSNPMQLQNMATQVQRFPAKAAQLPPVVKKVHRKPNKVPDASDEHRVPEAGESLDPAPQAEPEIAAIP